MNTEKPLFILMILAILLTSCGQASAAELAPAASAATATSEPTETPAVSQVERLLTAYLAGEEIDVSGLNPAEFREFSTALAERRNAERGINPIIYNNEAYISPTTT
jgi:PBP1b-binding outer membrane lipoprotein LpoB